MRTWTAILRSWFARILVDAFGAGLLLLALFQNYALGAIEIVDHDRGQEGNRRDP